jgi:hypothetical protein
MTRAFSAAVRGQGHDLGTCVAGSKHRDSDLILLGHYLVPHEWKDSGLVIGHQIQTTVRAVELSRDIVPEYWLHFLWRSSFCFSVLYPLTWKLSWPSFVKSYHSECFGVCLLSICLECLVLSSELNGTSCICSRKKGTLCISLVLFQEVRSHVQYHKSYVKVHVEFQWYTT